MGEHHRYLLIGRAQTDSSMDNFGRPIRYAAQMEKHICTSLLSIVMMVLGISLHTFCPPYHFLVEECSLAGAVAWTFYAILLRCIGQCATTRWVSHDAAYEDVAIKKQDSYTYRRKNGKSWVADKRQAKMKEEEVRYLSWMRLEGKRKSTKRQHHDAARGRKRKMLRSYIVDEQQG